MKRRRNSPITGSRRPAVRTTLPVIRVIVAGCILALSWSPRALSQVRQIRIETNNLAANVFADSTWIGVASARLFEVPAGTKRISLVPSSADAWSIPSVQHSLDSGSEEPLSLTLNFPYFYNLESIPSNAEVFARQDGKEIMLGYTPFTYSAESPLEGQLYFRREGFLEREVEPGDELWNRHLVSLPMKDYSGGTTDVRMGIRTQRRKWIDIAAVGTAVTAGVLAIHFKSKANQKFDRYKETGDPGLKNDIDLLDLYSGIALGTMQVGLGVFAFRLIF